MAWNDGEFVFFPTSNGAASDFKTASQSEKKTLFGKKKKKQVEPQLSAFFTPYEVHAISLGLIF